MSDKIEKLKQKLAAEQTARGQAVAAMSDDAREELELRRAIAAEREAREEEERERLLLDLEDRLDRAREVHGPKAALASLMVKGRSDTFVVTHSAPAFAKWQKDMAALVQGNKKLDQIEVTRAYAAASVVDWNGETDFNVTSPKASELVEFLKANAGVATAISNEAFELSGAAKEERKSAR